MSEFRIGIGKHKYTIGQLRKGLTAIGTVLAAVAAKGLLDEPLDNYLAAAALAINAIGVIGVRNDQPDTGVIPRRKRRVRAAGRNGADAEKRSGRTPNTRKSATPPRKREARKR